MTARDRRNARLAALGGGFGVVGSVFGPLYGAKYGIEKYFKASKKRGLKRPAPTPAREERKIKTSRIEKSLLKSKAKGDKSSTKMVKRGRQRNYGTRRKRVYKRRRYRRKTPYRRYRRNNGYRRGRFQKAVITNVSAPHVKLYENDYSADILAGKYYYLIPASLGAPSVLKTDWADTGEGSTVLGGNTAAESFCYVKGSLDMEIRNLNENPLYIEQYGLLARTDMCTGTDVYDNALTNLVEGWKGRMLDADETSVGITETTNSAYSSMKSLSLFHSSSLCEKWRIVRGRRRILKGGETMFVKYHTRCKKIRYRDIDDNNTTIGGFTILPVFKVYMALGKDTANQNEVLSLDGYFHCEYTIRHQFQYLTSHKPLIAVTNNKRSAFTTGGHGPCDVEMKTDDG